MKQAIERANGAIASSKHSKMGESDALSKYSRMHEVEDEIRSRQSNVDARSVMSKSNISLASMS